MIEIKIDCKNSEFDVSKFQITGRRAFVEYELLGLAMLITEAMCSEAKNSNQAIEIYEHIVNCLKDGCQNGLANYLRANQIGDN
ncbi:MAG: hypothetical protein MJZ17_11385 [Bacteroidales bacterium]|nr:hypothetical protein [Bacteroidales bacterium]